MAAQAIKSALPTHLKPGNGDEAEFTKRHHGKTRSHMVSFLQPFHCFYSESVLPGKRTGTFPAFQYRPPP